MALGSLLGRFRRPKTDPETRARLALWVRETLALGEADVVKVSEIDCNDPACGGVETVILVLRKGERTAAYKSRGSAVTQTRPLIVAALRSGA